MGPISWIKEKYYNWRYKDAETLYREGNERDAIEILVGLQDVHPQAVSKLLEIYHSQIKRGDKNAINYAATLFQGNGELKADCLNFCAEVGKTSKQIAIDYSSALYEKGLTEISHTFVENAKELVCEKLKNREKTPLTTLTRSQQPLIKELSNALCDYLKSLYQEGKKMEAANLSSYLIGELEQFVSETEFANKYVKVVVDQLLEYAKDGNGKDDALSLLKKACQVKFSPSYFSSIISESVEAFSKTIVPNIIDKTNNFLFSTELLQSFVTNLQGLSDKVFVVATLEDMLQAGYEIKQQYTDYNISRLNDEVPKTQLEIINRALSHVENEPLLNAKCEACEAYITKNPLGDDFICSQCAALVDKHPDAQILLTKIATNRASDESLGIEARATSIREAISFKSTHSTSFSQKKYDEELPRISKVANAVAKQLYEKKLLDEATSLLHHLRDNGIEWFETYVEIHTSINYKSPAEEISKLKAVADEGSKTGSAALKKLWERLLALIASEHESDDDSQKKEVYTQILESLSACKKFDGKDALIKKVTDILNQVHFNLGKQHEKVNDYKQAIAEYEAITDSFKQKDSATCRIMICELKGGKPLSKTKVEAMKECLNSNILDNIRKDLACRLCLYLAQKDDIEAARSINAQHLNDSDIEAFCADQIIKKQETELEELNNQISLLSQGQLTANEALLLGRNLSKRLEGISAIATLPEQTVRDFKESIRLYAIKQCYDEENYVKCYKGLKVQDSTYLTDLINLKNVAIMCINATENGQLTDEIYKECLAIWATTVYQQEIFIKSLDYTLWDDPYTFTLNSAFGVLPDNCNLPSNVGYDDETGDKVVAIRDVQKALISRMEIALEAYPEEYLDFFNKQIEAMDMLSKQQMDEPCVVVAPYLLQLSKQYRDSITKSLKTEENRHYDNWEKILRIGNLYGITTGGSFGNYQNAFQYSECAKDSLQTKKGVKDAFAQSRIDAIRNFDELFSSLVASIISALNESIAEETDYNEVAKRFYNLCEVINDDRLSVVFSNYINNKAIGAVNANSISLGKCASDLLKVYKIYKGNAKLNRNLKNIVSNLIAKYLMEKDDELLNALEKILDSTRDFDQSVIEALSGSADTPEDLVVLALILPNEDAFKTLKKRIGNKSNTINKQFNETDTKLQKLKNVVQLSEIVKDVNEGRMSKHFALNRVYDLYSTDKDNEKICQNLAILVVGCIMEYIPSNKQGVQSVRQVLNRLRNNMSPTFKRNNSAIRDAYNTINAGVLRERTYGRTLSYQGQEALDYLKSLM